MIDVVIKNNGLPFEITKYILTAIFLFSEEKAYEKTEELYSEAESSISFQEDFFTARERIRRAKELSKILLSLKDGEANKEIDIIIKK